MNTTKKISLTLIALFGFLFFAMIINVALNFRDFGNKGAEDRAKLTAEIVKEGLTAHMVNGIMDKRAFFLSKIEHAKNVKSLWIARSPSVIKQFGEGFNNEVPRDEIDKKVLSSGKIEKSINETISSSDLRITIPYIATSLGSPNCMSCHDAKEGEVLGVISMTLDTSGIRGAGLETIATIALVSLFMLILILFVINNYLKPYMNIFDSIKSVMKKTSEGDYSKRVDGGKTKESIEVSTWINNLLEKLQKVLDEIESKIDIFLTNRDKTLKIDPLIDINNTVSQLSDIYKFKRTIEHDEDIDQVYERLAFILKEKFKIDDFVFIEADTINKETKVIYIENSLHCSVEEKGCRADRTNTTIDSCMFENVCGNFKDKDMDYLCTPYSISNELDFIVSIVTKNKEESARIRKLAPEMQDYIDTARPEIVSKKLTRLLRETARIDQLTNMYNRKYLDEFIEKAIPQAKRAGIPYGILMLDIDFFKMVNDTYGHDVGDEAIKVVANVIKENIRNSDIAIRFGGEEFIVLLYNCKKELMSAVAEKIRVAFSKKKIFAGNESFTKTISIGVSSFPKDSESIWKCIKFADIALYQAKEQGRDRVIGFDSSMLKNGSSDEPY